MCFVTDRGQLREEFTFPHLPFTFTCTIFFYHLLKPSTSTIYLFSICTKWKLFTVGTWNVPNTAHIFAWNSCPTQNPAGQCKRLNPGHIGWQSCILPQGHSSISHSWHDSAISIHHTENSSRPAVSLSCPVPIWPRHPGRLWPHHSGRLWSDPPPPREMCNRPLRHASFPVTIWARHPGVPRPRHPITQAHEYNSPLILRARVS